MGICWCKEKHEESESYLPQQANDQHIDVTTIQSISNVPEYYMESAEKTSADSATVDHLVLETLGIIGTIVDK